MSWSITFIGKPENIVTALKEQSAQLEGQSKVEYNSVLPHMIGLVKENFGESIPILKIVANGHGTVYNGEQKERYCAVSVERIYGVLV